MQTHNKSCPLSRARKNQVNIVQYLHMWIRIYDQTHSQKFFVGRSNGGAEQRQPVNHRCPERRCNKQLKYVGPIQKIEAAAISINFSNDHPKCCFMEWSLLIWLTPPFHSPTAVPWGRGEREWLLRIREREGNWKNPFPKFGNGKGIKKNHSRNSGTGRELKKPIPEIREREGN